MGGVPLIVQTWNELLIPCLPNATRISNFGCGTKGFSLNDRICMPIKTIWALVPEHIVHHGCQGYGNPRFIDLAYLYF
jgi:hypothetical protein